MTRFRWSAFFLVLPCLVIQMMPRALGERSEQHISKRTLNVRTPSELDGGTWTFTGSLNTGRYFHTATLLPSGIVLVAGGFGASGTTSSEELRDGESGTWRSTSCPNN